MTRPIRIAIVDDHDLVREGLRAVLAQHDDLEVVGEAATAEDAVRLVLARAPEALLLDLRLGDHDGAEVARTIRARGYRGTILALSIHESSRDLQSALAAGVDGYVLKRASAAALAEGIRDAVGGRAVAEPPRPHEHRDEAKGRGDPGPALPITARERQVLELVAAGATNRAIAEKLGISARTAQKHVENLFRKVGVHERPQLVSEALRLGLLG